MLFEGVNTCEQLPLKQDKHVDMITAQFENSKLGRLFRDFRCGKSLSPWKLWQTVVIATNFSDQP